MAQQEVRVLTAEKEQQASCIRHLRAEIDRLESRNRQHEVEASKQLQRVKVNYQILYDKFNKLRGQNFEVQVTSCAVKVCMCSKVDSCASIG